MPVWSLKLGICKHDDVYMCMCMYMQTGRKLTDYWNSLEGEEGTEEQKKNTTKIWIKNWNVFLFHYF